MNTSPFGTRLRFSMALSIFIALAAALCQLIVSFPPGSLGLSISAAALLLSAVALAILVPIGLVKLVRFRSARSALNFVVTLLGAVPVLGVALLAFAVFMR